MAKKFYITTTIPYSNAAPHIGHALEFVQADVLARWNKIRGNDVFFLTGTDEHGSKNYQTAKAEGIDPKKFSDRNSEYFRDIVKKLNLSNTYFIRTTDRKVHWPGVIEIWNRLAKKGDIYKKKYSGDYCSGCERFVTKKDLVKGRCPNHPNLKLEYISEENYFFRLSKYSDKIKKLIEKNELKISPTKWKKDFLLLIKDGLTDISFSREKRHLPWGIPVPGDNSQVMYVWPDALTNYLTGVGFPDKKFKKYWPANIHVVGKDMLRFHTGIWPGMLLSAGLPLPKEVIVHGFLTSGGRKMSKSLGNVIDPLELLEKYHSDSLRYSLLRSTPFGDDGDFSERSLIDRHNNELADKLGNLVSRVSALAEKYGIEKMENKFKDQSLKIKPKIINSKNIGFPRGTVSESKLEREKLIGGSRISLDITTKNEEWYIVQFGKDINKPKYLVPLIVDRSLENYEFDKALSWIFVFIDYCNWYIQDKKPWETQDKKVLYELSDSIKAIAILLWPFIPETSEKIAKQFGFKISLKELDKPLKIIKIKKSPILFKKIK